MIAASTRLKAASHLRPVRDSDRFWTAVAHLLYYYIKRLFYIANLRNKHSCKFFYAVIYHFGLFALPYIVYSSPCNQRDFTALPT